MKVLSSLVCFFLAIQILSAQGLEKDKFTFYSKVRIFARSADDLRILQSADIDIDHYVGKVGQSIEVVISKDEIDHLQRTGMPYEILIADMDEYYSKRPRLTEADLARSRAILHANGIEGFGYGSMGGFYTYAEMVRQLDTMRMQYPNLITAKESLGVTTQGRTIWGVEVSDNPGVPEPDEAVVYFDGLHHAREPISMTLLIYYMWWLLGNYGTNPEATYLVNNRRICFIPIVNPDGYYYNQSTYPSGGGSWRKNRRNNGDGSYGVDLNRNYGYMWGYDNIGSSPTPSSDTYRGPSAWSEPETRAVRDFVQARYPAIAFSTHSVAGHYLNPYGYKDTVVSYEYYAEFASDFSRYNNYLYGTVMQMLSYNSNGTTRDWLHHDANCLAWTPEIGGSDFWPLQSEIVPLCQENLLAVKYLTWVSGAFADYHSFRLIGREFVLPGDTLRLSVTLYNKGLTRTARNVTVSVDPLNANVSPIFNSVPYDSIGIRQTVSNDSIPFAFTIDASTPFLTELKFAATVRQECVITSVDTFSLVVGYPRILFADDGEAGIGRWTRSGTGVQWDTTFVMAFDGSRSIADSRYGNVANTTANYLTMTSQVDLTNTVNPRLEYYARWANEIGYDYTRIQISTNNGSTWTSLAGRHTTTISGGPGYTSNKGYWAWEHINLNSYIGRQIKLRFNQYADSGVRGDGFYFDNLRVVDYRDSVVTDAAEAAERPLQFALEQNYPNPFNPSTVFNFQIPTSNWVTLKIFDVLGRDVATLVNEELKPGRYEVVFDGSNLASGVYFYRLAVGSSSTNLPQRFLETKKLLLMR